MWFFTVVVIHRDSRGRNMMCTGGCHCSRKVWSLYSYQARNMSLNGCSKNSWTVTYIEMINTSRQVVETDSKVEVEVQCEAECIVRNLGIYRSQYISNSFFKTCLWKGTYTWVECQCLLNCTAWEQIWCIVGARGVSREEWRDWCNRLQRHLPSHDSSSCVVFIACLLHFVLKFSNDSKEIIMSQCQSHTEFLPMSWLRTEVGVLLALQASNYSIINELRLVPICKIHLPL